MSNRMTRTLHPLDRWAACFRDATDACFASAKYNIYSDCRQATFHDNRIAWRDEAGVVWMSLCGWGTPTTRQRLNALCAAFRVPGSWHQARNEQFYDGQMVDVWDRVALCGPMTQLALDFEQAERALRAA